MLADIVARSCFYRVSLPTPRIKILRIAAPSALKGRKVASTPETSDFGFRVPGLVKHKREKKA